MTLCLLLLTWFSKNNLHIQLTTSKHHYEAHVMPMTKPKNYNTDETEFQDNIALYLISAKFLHSME